MFANPECTAYANGTESTVYCRVNVPWLSPWDYHGSDSYQCIDLSSYPFQLILWVDYQGPETEEQPVAGQIIPIEIFDPHENPIEGLQTVFTKP